MIENLESLTLAEIISLTMRTKQKIRTESNQLMISMLQEEIEKRVSSEYKKVTR